MAGHDPIHDAIELREEVSRLVGALRRQADALQASLAASRVADSHLSETARQQIELSRQLLERTKAQMAKRDN
jgi:hypothetical protein